MFAGLKTSPSSSILHAPAQHFESLHSPKAQVRSRTTSGDAAGLLSAADTKTMSSAPGGSGGDDVLPISSGGPRPRSSLTSPAGGSLSMEAVEELAARVAPATLRAASWGVLQAVLLLGMLRYLYRLSEPNRDLWFLYFQPPLPMLAMLWLWAAAVRLFERRRIRYEACFAAEHQRYLLRSAQLFQVANVLTAVVLSLGLAFTYLLAYGLPHLAAYLPPVLYCGLLGLLLFPGGLLHRDARLFFGQTLWRVATPIRPVAWSDFLLADILTSLAKGISDTERAVCHIMVGPVMQPGVQACSDVSLLLPLGLAAPYAWRLVQCLRVYLDTGARPQLFNALKYSTAFPVIALSFVKYHVPHADWAAFWKPLWLASALLNSGYSFYWDVERDWEISWFSQMGQRRGALPPPVLRSHLFFRRPLYLYLMASNLLLRLSWTYKLSPHLRDHHIVVTLIVLAEAFRRFQWLFVRVEVELRKIQAHRPELGTLVPAAPREAHVHGHSGEGGHAPDSGSEEESDARRGASSGNTPTKERRKERRGGGGPGRVVQLPVLDMNPRR